MSSRLNYNDLSQLMQFAEDVAGSLESIAESLETLAKGREKTDG